MVLLSGVAVGLFFMVTNESRMGGNDLEANQAFYGAESGMEKLTADLSALYTQFQVPTNAQIQNQKTPAPTSAMVTGMPLHRDHHLPAGRPRTIPRAALTPSVPVPIKACTLKSFPCRCR